jgi:branched-chain amino acid transport system substrate-binding protein
MIRSCRTAAVTGAAVAVSMLLSGCGGGESVGESGDAINIVTALPFSGGLAQPGRDVFAGADIARKMINDAGGVKGRQVNFIRNDVPDAKAAVAEFNRSIADGHRLFFCCYSSAINLAASQVTERNQALIVEPGAVAPEITGRGFKYVLRTTTDAVNYAQGAVASLHDVFLPKLGKNTSQATIALVYEQGSFGQGFAKAVTKLAGQRGIKIVADESYDPAATDLSSLVLKVKRAQPTAVLATSYDNDAVLFWDQARQQGLRPEIMIGSGGGYSSQVFPEREGEHVEGLFESSSSANVQSSALMSQTQQVVRDFLAGYQRGNPGKTPSNQVVLGFVGMYTLLKYVMPAAEDPTDPRSVREAAGRVDVPAGALPTGWGVKFGENGQNARAFSTVQQWQNQKLVVVYPQKYATAQPSMIPLPAWGER